MFRRYLLFLLLISKTALADSPVLTLDKAIQAVLEHNADIRATHYHAEAARSKITQAKALDDPMIGVMFWNVPRDTVNVREGEEIDYRIDQKIPFPGKRYLKGKSARYEAKMENHLAQAKVEDVLFDLKETYSMAYKLEEQKRINSKLENLLQLLVTSTQAWYASNQTTTDTVLKAQLELTRIKNERLMLDQEETTHLSHLRALMNLKSHEEIIFPNQREFPPIPESESEREMLMEDSFKHRPDIQAMESAEKKEKTNLTLAKSNLIPDFSLGFQYNQTRDMKDTWTGSASINFPLLFLGKRHAEIQEAKANLKATQAERESMLQHQHHEIDQAYTTVFAAKKILNQFQKEILPQSQLLFESARESYAAKKIDFMSLIDAARMYREAQMNYAEQESFLGIAIAKLERMMGKSLKHSKGNL